MLAKQSRGGDAADARLAQLFADDHKPIADEGFTLRVMTDIYRRQRLRTLVIASAALVGIFIVVTQALAPAVALMGALSRGLVAGGADLSGFSLATLLAGLLLGLAPLMARQMDR